jgi:signal transduction histidine kinase
MTPGRPIRPEVRSLRVRLHVDPLVIDAILKIFAWWALGDLLDLGVRERDALAIRCVWLGVVTAAGAQIALAVLYAPIVRARRAPSDATIIAGSVAAARAPRRVAAILSVFWLAWFVPTAGIALFETPEINVPPQALPATALFLLTQVAGVAVLAFCHTLWIMGPVTGRLSVEARQRGLVIPSRRVSLRARNVLFTLAAVLGSSAWLASADYLSAVRAGLRRLEDAAGLAAGHVARRLAGGASFAAAAEVAQGEPHVVFVLDGAGRVVARRASGGAELPDALIARALAGLARGGDHFAVTDPRSERSVAVVRAGDRVVGVAARGGAAAGDWPRRILLFFPAIAAYSLLTSLYLLTHMAAGMRNLAKALKAIARQGGVHGMRRLPVMQHDEIGALVGSANEMIDRLDEAQAASRAAAASLRDANARLEERVRERTAELEENLARLSRARSELAEAARRAGMAEVASSVLHNVGNVLNSVNVTTTLVADRLRNSKAPAVRRAMALVPEDEAAAAAFLSADSRGRVLPAYLRRLGDTLCADNEQLGKEIAFLQKNVDHIKVIVSLQQEHARHGGLVEPVRIAELIDDAIRFSLASAESAGLRVDRELAPLPEVTTDRHRLFQILVNLLRNARDAVAGRAEQRLVVRARRDGDGVAIEVADDGCGIAPENLARIFSLGFTTKPDGHGYGLHSSAIAARELGGAITVDSPGLERGTTFTVRLPAVSQQPRQDGAAVLTARA